MSNNLAKFYRMGYTSKSIIPNIYFDDIKDYHPAFIPNTSSDKFQLKTDVGFSSRSYYLEMIPVDEGSGDWNGTNIQVFQNLKLRFVSEKRLSSPNLNVRVVGNYYLKQFELIYDDSINSGDNLIFEAILTWDILGIEFQTKWFWIPD